MGYRPALALLSMLLGSCQLGVEVQVTGTPSAPVIELDDGSEEGPAIDHVSVWRAGARQPFWELRGADCLPARRVRYGGLLPGFAAEGAAAPLEPGRAYMVEVEGCGHSGGAWFKIVGGRIVSRDGMGEAAQREVERAR